MPDRNTISQLNATTSTTSNVECSDSEGENSEIADELDKDELTRPRLFDFKPSSCLHRFHKEDRHGQGTSSIKYDHQPREVFVEMDVLSDGPGDEREWKETGRWIKYQEDVEEGADRFGKAHYPTLSFASLVELRNLIVKGLCLIDIEAEANDLTSIAYRVTNEIKEHGLISEEDTSQMMRTLLLKHKHVDDRDKSWKFNLRRNTKEFQPEAFNLHPIFEDKSKSKGQIFSHPRRSGAWGSASSSFEVDTTRRNSAVSRLMSDNIATISEDADDNTKTTEGNKNIPPLQNGQIGILMSTQSKEDAYKSRSRRFSVLSSDSIMKKVSPSAEACITLVGEEDTLSQTLFAFIRMAESIILTHLTDYPIPVKFIYFILQPSDCDLDIKEIGRSISALMVNRTFCEIAYKADCRKDLLKGIHAVLDESLVLPPGDFHQDVINNEELKQRHRSIKRRHEKRRRSIIVSKDITEPILEVEEPLLLPPPITEPNPFRWTGCILGGLYNDIRKRYPFYISDWIDGINLQCFLAILFLYFTTLAVAFAFGALLAKKTDGHIGIAETVITTASSGIIFSLISGQPLIILGPTIQTTLLDQAIYTFCQSNGVDFLSARIWIGVWVGILGLVFVSLEGSVVARYLTRFTQEIFTTLICLLFIIEGLSCLVKVYMSHPIQQIYGRCEDGSLKIVDEDSRPNTFLIEATLCLCTFLIAYTFNATKKSKYFAKWLRKSIGLLCVPSAITFFAYLLNNYVMIEKLSIESELQTTMSRDSWLVDPHRIHSWMPFTPIACILPGVLVFIVIFMESSICQLIIGDKSRKLKKGCGYHLDLLIICLLNAVVPIFGGCWICATMFQSISHVSSLTLYSTNNAPGEKAGILGVKEQRLSALVVSLLVGLSILIFPILVLIPLTVLPYGIFIFIGVVSTEDIQLVNRIALLTQSVERHPQVPYVRRVLTRRMNVFTLIQCCCLLILCTLIYTPATLTYPFILLFVISLRQWVIPRWFKYTELIALDGDWNKLDMKDNILNTPPELSQVQIAKTTLPMPAASNVPKGHNRQDFRCI